MKRVLRLLHIFVWVLLCWSSTQQIQAQRPLSPEATISLLTFAPSEDEIYTVYGHAALRVHDPAQQLDLVFSYGVFNFNEPHFVYRFTKGETDYQLGIASFQNCLMEYQMRGSQITEQTLQLLPEEKEAVWQALQINYRPENRRYRYNFFFDNCATRPVRLIEQCVQGELDYGDPYPTETFRTLINRCTRHFPWLTFGCDLALGSPADRMATQHEMMFLPPYLQRAWSQAIIHTADGKTRQLVGETRSIGVDSDDEPEDTGSLCSPLLIGWLLFGCIGWLTISEWRRATYWPWIDRILFSIAGLAGCLLAFLSFLSSHPCTYPNWNLGWLHPFHLIGVVLLCVKSWKKGAICYHFINFAALCVGLVAWPFIPQHFNAAFFPLVLTLACRSGWSIYRTIWTKE